MKVTVDPLDLKCILLAVPPDVLTKGGEVDAYGRLWGAATRTGHPGKKKATVMYRLVCTQNPNDKIAVIKCLRAMFGLGLKEAKDIVDAGGAFSLPADRTLAWCTEKAGENGCTVNKV